VVKQENMITAIVRKIGTVFATWGDPGISDGTHNTVSVDENNISNFSVTTAG
jgi:hypothetical protein